MLKKEASSHTFNSWWFLSYHETLQVTIKTTLTLKLILELFKYQKYKLTGVEAI